MTRSDARARELVDLGLEALRLGNVAEAIEHYDSARGFAESEELLELITIRKAEALLDLETDGPEVKLLPQIVMRRRSAYHVYLAAYILIRKLVDAGDARRALFYGYIAAKAATELEDSRARANVMNGIGIALMIDSRFSEAIGVFEEALVVVNATRPDGMQEEARLRAIVRENLAGAIILKGDAAAGVPMLEAVLPEICDDYNLTEAFVDLAFGCMHLKRYPDASVYAERALERATVPRQVRNANHVLGEIASRTGQHEKASQHYDVVASFYPDFKNAKELLMAVDVLSVVNWKA